MKKALITGITGQDGSYLAEQLIEKNYIVHGVVRRSSSFNRGRIEHIYLNKSNNNSINQRSFFLHYGDITDFSSLVSILNQVRPNEIYNLAAQSHVAVSFETPEYTSQCDAVGVLKLLEAVKQLGIDTKIYQASTSEIFGNVQEVPQSETTSFYPRSPYGVAKLYGFWISVNYREAFDQYISNGILFNHESPRRGESFVTKKITSTATRIKFGSDERLILGNLNAKRDWGYAPEYCEGMWKIMQLDYPEDFVLATGETHTVREFCETAFNVLDIDVVWEGEGVNEIGIDKKTNNIIVSVNKKYYRPTEVDLLVGNSEKAKKLIGWNPQVKFHELIEIMVKHDMSLLKGKIE